jgi:hypothetical protein
MEWNGMDQYTNVSECIDGMYGMDRYTNVSENSKNTNIKLFQGKPVGPINIIHTSTGIIKWRNLMMRLKQRVPFTLRVNTSIPVHAD